MAKFNIGLAILAWVVDPKVAGYKKQAFRSIKKDDKDFSRVHSQLGKDYDLFRSNDQSEIIGDSEPDYDDTKDEDRVVTNILSKFHPAEDKNDKVIDEELAESSSSNAEILRNEFIANRRSINNDNQSSNNPNSKAPLSIEILDEESEDEELANQMILNSKGEKPLNNDGSDVHPDDEDEENDSNYSPWVYKASNKKLSPFQNYK